MTLLSSVRMQALSTLFQGTAFTRCGLPTTLGKLSTSPGTGSNMNSSLLPEDTLAIRQPLKALSESGLDLQKSRFVESAEFLSFNLSYEEQSLQQVSLQGYYDSYAERLSADFSFISAMAVKDPTTGEEKQELFRFNFHLEASHSLTRTGSSSVQKEDILQFARRLVTKISKLYADGKEIDGLALDSEDLKDLAAVDDGKLLKHIMTIIELMKMVARLKQKEGEHVWVDLERGKGLVSQEMAQEQEGLEFSLTVERVQTESTSGPPPTAVSPETD